MTDEGDSEHDGDEWPEEWSRRERELVEQVEAALGEHRDDVERRHWIQALGALGLVGAGSRELYRRNILSALPDVKYRPDAEGDAWDSSWHPSRESVPDGMASGTGFAALVALAWAGSRRRADDQPLLSLATAGLSLLQAAGSTQHLVENLKRGDVDAFSSIESIVSAATVPLAIPEAVRALRGLLGR